LHRGETKGTETVYIWDKHPVSYRSEQRRKAPSSREYPLATARGEMAFDAPSNP